MTGREEAGEDREPTVASAGTASGAAEARDARVRTVEVIISGVLRGGVTLSLLVVAAGLGVSFVGERSYRTSRHLEQAVVHGRTSYPTTLPALFHGLAAGQGRALVVLGLLLLLLTPVARVAVSIVLFAAQRDRKFVAITCFVLAMLVVSYFLGQVGAR